MSYASFARLAEAVLAHHRRAGTKLATAESCTGGAIAAALTEIAGSSDVFERGFVTYSNEAKSELLGVPAPLKWPRRWPRVPSPARAPTSPCR